MNFFCYNGNTLALSFGVGAATQPRPAFCTRTSWTHRFCAGCRLTFSSSAARGRSRRTAKNPTRVVRDFGRTVIYLRQGEQSTLSPGDRIELGTCCSLVCVGQHPHVNSFGPTSLLLSPAVFLGERASFAFGLELLPPTIMHPRVALFLVPNGATLAATSVSAAWSFPSPYFLKLPSPPNRRLVQREEYFRVPLGKRRRGTVGFERCTEWHCEDTARKKLPDSWCRPECDARDRHTFPATSYPCGRTLLAHHLVSFAFRGFVLHATCCSRPFAHCACTGGAVRPRSRKEVIKKAGQVVRALGKPDHAALTLHFARSQSHATVLVGPGPVLMQQAKLGDFFS